MGSGCIVAEWDGLFRTSITPFYYILFVIVIGDFDSCVIPAAAIDFELWLDVLVNSDNNVISANALIQHTKCVCAWCVVSMSKGVLLLGRPLKSHNAGLCCSAFAGCSHICIGDRNREGSAPLFLINLETT